MEPGFRMKQTIDIITTFEPFAHFSDPFGLANTKNPHGLLTFRTRSDRGAKVRTESETGNEQTVETVCSLFGLSDPHTV